MSCDNPYCFEICQKEYIKNNPQYKWGDFDTIKDDRPNSKYDYALYLLADEKKTPIYGEQFCVCEIKPELKEQKILEYKLNQLRQEKLYPILHFLAQNYEPPITDEEMAQQLQ